MKFFTGPILWVSLTPLTSEDLDLGGHEDTWSDQVEDNEPTTNSTLPDSSTTVVESTGPPPTTLIYTCEGSAAKLAYCQFPFSTLAGNEYTNSCADKVEDNPDVSVDRPWCFVSATKWGFCDCQANLDFNYIATHHEIRVQANLDYPGTVWCALMAEKDTLPSLAMVVNGTEPGRYQGGWGEISAGMIMASIDAQIVFSANFTNVTKNFIACQANVPGIAIQPTSVGTLLGSQTPDDPEPETPEHPPPQLITRTNGATIYSIIIMIVLGSFIGVRYALDQRRLIMFSLLAQDPKVAR